jgi:hypothetical protein
MAGGSETAVVAFKDANNKMTYVSPTNPLPVTGGGGGGGGGGAVTSIDGGIVTIGAKADTAATDTTSAWSLVSLLKGILGKLSAALAVTVAQLPASLGIKTSAASLSVTPASDANFATTLTSGTAVALTAGQIGGTTIALPNANGVQLQFTNLAADNLTVTHSVDGTNFVAATLLKQDLSQTTMSAATGAGQNGIYSVMVFGGYLKVLKNGTADTTFSAYMRVTS